MLKTIHLSKAFRVLALALAAAVPLAFLGQPARATTTSPATNTFQVSANVQAACSVTATDYSFGSYDPTSTTANTSGSSTISVTCTNSTAYVVALSYGANGGTQSNRVMKDSGTDTLNYNLYTNAGTTNVWYDIADGCDLTSGSGSSDCASGTGNTGSTVSATDYTVYGKIAAGQNVPAGTYTDTITVSVSF